MTDIQKAMLGDKEAAKRLTEKGELLPCPFCGENPSERARAKVDCISLTIRCFNCQANKTKSVDICDTEFAKLENAIYDVIKDWNTRPQLLTKEQIEALERMEEDRKIV